MAGKVLEKMPNRDGTGPNGQGPMTGRSQGECRFRSPTSPFRGSLNLEDLKPLIREVVLEVLKKQQ